MQIVEAPACSASIICCMYQNASVVGIAMLGHSPVSRNCTGHPQPLPLPLHKQTYAGTHSHVDTQAYIQTRMHYVRLWYATNSVQTWIWCCEGSALFTKCFATHTAANKTLPANKTLLATHPAERVDQEPAELEHEIDESCSGHEHSKRHINRGCDMTTPKLRCTVDVAL